VLTVLKREMLGHLQSSQFVLLLTVATALFLANGLVFSGRYARQAAWYSETTAQTQQNPSTAEMRLQVRPSPLALVSQGSEESRSSEYVLRPTGLLQPFPREARNYKMPDMPQLDWSFIVKAVFSLYVMLLGYAAISGEREAGTLRLALSYPLGRTLLLAGKFTAILLATLVPLAIGVLLSLTLMWVSGVAPDVLSLPSLARIALSICTAVLYLSLFASLSLLVSALVRSPSVGLLVLLVTWVVMVVLVPNVSGTLADQFSGVPGEYQTARQTGPMLQHFYHEAIDAVEKRVKTGELTTEDQVRREADLVYQDVQRRVIGIFESYYNRMAQRADVTRGISRASPASLYQYASESVVGTGIAREKAFVRDALEYSHQYDQYVLSKVGKLVATSGWGFSGNMDVGGKRISISSPQPEEYKGDMSDFPRFRESKPSLIDGIKHALPDLLGLILWNLVLAAAAFWAILRADVR
jgi:ABC-type transport system involved in multi-copper enzyme maturation permease subunit